MLTALLPGCGLLYTAIIKSGISEKQAWTDVDIRGLDPNMSNLTLAISAVRVPFILYKVGTNDFKLSMVNFERGRWVSVDIESPDFSPENPFSSCFALDATGVPYAIYGGRIGNEEKIWLMKMEKNAWVFVGPQIVLGKKGSLFCSLALDVAEIPYVVYSDFDNNEHKHKLFVVKLEKGAWVSVGPSIYSLRDVAYPSLALNAAGTPYLAYMDFGYDARLSVVKLEGDTWVPVGPPGFSMKTDGYPSLALDAAGVPYVAYHGNEDSNFRLLVMKYEGDAWVFVGPPETSPKWINYPSMILDATGVPHVAYLNYDFSGPKFWMTKVEGGNWVPVKPPDFSSEKAEPPPSVQKK